MKTKDLERGSCGLYEFTASASIKNTEKNHYYIKTIGNPAVRSQRYQHNEMFCEK
jgi:hypothetical protein